MVKWLPDICGKFGCDNEKHRPVTIGMNKKDGMDAVEFEKYICG